MLKEIERAVQEMHSRAEINDFVAFLLSIHACLMRQESVPRAWLPLDPDAATNPFSRLLLARIEPLGDETRHSLRQAHLLPLRLNAMTGKNRELALQLCEEHLESMHGKGFLCYEQIRLTPFAEDRLFDYLQLHSQVASPSLQAILSLRHRRLEECWRRYGDEAVPRGDGRQSTLWQRALQEKIESQWQAVWMPPDLYDCDSREQSIINSLALDEAL